MYSNRKYRFLFVSAPFSGIEVYVRNLKEIVLRQDDIEAEWMFVEWDPPEMFANVLPFSLNWTLKAGYVVRKRRAFLERQGRRFDAVFYNNIILPSLLPSTHKKVPSVICLDVTPKLLESVGPLYGRDSGSLRWFGGGIVGKALTRRVYRDASRIIAWSDLVRNSLISDYGAPQDRIEIVPPGIDLSYWHPRHRQRQTARTQILFVGGDFERKGGPFLLQCAGQEQFSDCDFHFVTKGFTGETRGNVFVYPDIAPNSEALRALYCRSDIFVLPTLADFSPNAICEAMGCGMPVVSTRVGAIHEMVADRVSGYLLEPGDTGAFERSLLDLVQNPDRRVAMGEKGREFALQHCDRDRNAARVLDIMKEAASPALSRHSRPFPATAGS